MKKLGIGLIGCGNISGIYLKNLTGLFDFVEVKACADLDPAPARARAEEFGVPRACGVEEMLADPAVEMVVNLTVPLVHAEVSLAALRAGKHVYSEKPLAVNRADGQAIMREAQKRSLLVGCAPDTFLGAGLQTCRRLIDDGAIGRPVAATAFMVGHGPESWHPNPGFYYQPGGGPLFDMGPYYLTAMVSLLGPVRRVAGLTRISQPERVIGSELRRGEIIQVETATHVAGILDFACGAVGTMVMSFDVWGANLPRIEIYGTEGSLSVPDPNCFGGEIKLLQSEKREWNVVPLESPYSENSRGLGAADMAAALAAGRPHRASGQLAMHVLDIMQSIQEASDRDRHMDISSPCDRPAPLPAGLSLGQVD